MSDFNSSQPIRTENNGDVVINVADGTTQTQLLAIDSGGKVTAKLNDGAGNAVTSQVNGAQQALDVGLNVAGVQIDPRSIRALTSADAITTVQGTANSAANGWPVKPTDGINSQSYTAAGEAKVLFTSALPAGGNNIGAVNAELYVSNSPVTVVNPIPVTITSGSAGTPIQSFQTSAALAAGSSATLTYTVPAGHTFSLERVWATASGKIKIIVQNGATTIFAGFNSTSSPNIDIDVTAPPTIAAAGTVNVIVTNEDKSAFDVYATIEGNQIT